MWLHVTGDPFGGSPKEQERARLAKLLPPQLDMTPRWTGPVRTARIRVWADADFRAQNLRWREAFGEQLEYANAVLEPTLGVHLVAEYREWEFRAPPGSPLQDTLEVLAQHDPGTDVLSVVGLVSSLSLVSATFDELGRAESPGNHVVLRGYADLAERAMFERAFPKLSADERDGALEARRRHKTTTLLLHEVVHNLGVLHDPEPDGIMSAVYSDHATSFTELVVQVAKRTPREIVVRVIDRAKALGVQRVTMVLVP